MCVCRCMQRVEPALLSCSTQPRRNQENSFSLSAGAPLQRPPYTSTTTTITFLCVSLCDKPISRPPTIAPVSAAVQDEDSLTPTLFSGYRRAHRRYPFRVSCVTKATNRLSPLHRCFYRWKTIENHRVTATSSGSPPETT